MNVYSSCEKSSNLTSSMPFFKPCMRIYPIQPPSHKPSILLGRAICHGPWVSLQIFAGYAKNARYWLLFIQVIFQGCSGWSIFRAEVMPSPSSKLSSTYYKRNESPPNLVFLSCNATHCVCRHPSMSILVTRGGLRRHGELTDMKLQLLLLPWVMKFSLTQESHVHYHETGTHWLISF